MPQRWEPPAWYNRSSNKNETCVNIMPHHVDHLCIFEELKMIANHFNSKYKAYIPAPLDTLTSYPKHTLFSLDDYCAIHMGALGCVLGNYVCKIILYELMSICVNTCVANGTIGGHKCSCGVRIYVENKMTNNMA